MEESTNGGSGSDFAGFEPLDNERIPHERRNNEHQRNETIRAPTSYHSALNESVASTALEQRIAELEEHLRIARQEKIGNLTKSSTNPFYETKRTEDALSFDQIMYQNVNRNPVVQFQNGSYVQHEPHQGVQRNRRAYNDLNPFGGSYEFWQDETNERRKLQSSEKGHNFQRQHVEYEGYVGRTYGNNRHAPNAEQRQRYDQHDFNEPTFQQHVYREDYIPNQYIQQRQPIQIQQGRKCNLNFAELIPDFDPTKTPQTAKKWLTNIENLSFMYASDENVLLHHAIVKLKGAARFWFDGLSNNQCLTWTTFKWKLVAAFPSYKTESDIHFMLTQRTQKPAEPFEEYFYEMVAIARRADLGEDSTIKYIIMGLNDEDLRKSLAFSQVMSLNELLGRAQWADSFKGQARHRKIPGSTGGTTNIIKCYNCNKSGHISVNCPEPQKKPRCSKCNKPGHNEENCYSNGAPRTNSNRPNTHTTTIRHVLEEENEVNKPFFIYMQLDTLNIFTLIDTGSPINIIKNKFIAIDRHLRPVSDRSYFGIGESKTKLNVLGLISIPVVVKNIHLVVDFHVVPDGAMDVGCVLGGEFLKMKCIRVDINGSSGEVHIRNSELENDIFMIEIDNNEKSNLEIDIGDDQTSHIERSLIEEVFKNFEKLVVTENPESEHTMTISVKKDEPFYFSPRRFSFFEQKEIEIIIQDLLNQGIIRESNSPYASRVVLLKKKDGSKRMCIDFRELNKRTVRDVHPIPLIDDQLDRLRGKRYFSLIDLKSGFHHIKVQEESRKYTAFVTASGQYEYNRVPFGLCNGPAVFTRFINHILRPLIRTNKIQVYIDDILIATSTVIEHTGVLNELFAVLKANTLQLQWQKCKFLKTKIEFLGYEVSETGIKPSQRHIEAVTNFPIPRNVHELYRFIGLTSFFRRFIENHSVLAKPLYDLLRKDSKFVFGASQLHAFELLKKKLCSDPVLRIFNPLAETELHTDASSVGFGACLIQKQETDNRWHPVMFYSKRATDTESRYHSFELETLAVIYALKRFRVYVHGIKFTIVTDCNSLKQTLAKQELNHRIARWALELQNYDYDIVHRESRRMQHVDALSRNLIMVLEEGSFEQTLALQQIKDESIIKVRKKIQKGDDKFFEIRDGLVYRKSNGRLLFYVPEQMQTNVIRKSHDDVGHVGVDKAMEIITRVYWFPELKVKVKNHIDNCLSCITFNPKYGKKEGWLNPIDKGKVPFNTIHIDHLGPLETTPRGYKYVLLVADAFSKFVKIFPTKTTNSKEAIKCLGKYFDEYSCPVRIISDRGTGFTSRKFKEFVDEHNIIHVMAATASPQSNGQVEIMNKFLVPVLSKLVGPGKMSAWDKVIVDAEHTFNNTVNKSIGTTPSKALFGVHQKRTNDDVVRMYLENLQNDDCNLISIREQIQEQNKQAQAIYKKHFDKKRKAAVRYKIGDFVMLKNVVTEAGINHKLLPKFKGPYKIAKILGNDRYKVTDIPGFQVSRCKFEGVFPAFHMRPWMQTNNTDETNDKLSDSGTDNSEFSQT